MCKRRKKPRGLSSKHNIGLNIWKNYYDNLSDNNYRDDDQKNQMKTFCCNMDYNHCSWLEEASNCDTHRVNQTAQQEA
jgi:hypothetical protein